MMVILSYIYQFSMIRKQIVCVSVEYQGGITRGFPALHQLIPRELALLVWS